MGKPAKAPDPKKEAELAAKKIEKAEADLVKACKNDEEKKAKKAIEAGAKLDIDASGVGALSTPMHVAAGYGSYEVCKYLVEVGGMELLQSKNRKEKTPLDVAEQVGEDKIIRLLQALLKGEKPPEEKPDADDDDDDDLAPPEGDAPAAAAGEAYPVDAPAKGEAAPAKADAAVPAAPEAELAGAMAKLRIAHFSMAAGKLGMSLEGNVVSKVGEASSQAGSQGVRAGWVLRYIGDAPATEETKAIMKQAAQALKAAGAEAVPFQFEVRAERESS